jgi:Phage Tail Collar Domain
MMERRAFLKKLGVTWDIPTKLDPNGSEFDELAGSNTPRRSIAGKFNPPVGTLLVLNTNKAMPGWLICNGSYHKIAEYPNLFLFLGDSYGERYGWDGKSDDFRVPAYTTTDISILETYLIKAS